MQVTWGGVAIALVIGGMLLALVGAAYAANAVILTEIQATALASTKWNLNAELRDALLDQSRAAAWGLRAVALGTAAQVAGTFMQWWRPRP